VVTTSAMTLVLSAGTVNQLGANPGNSHRQGPRLQSADSQHNYCDHDNRSQYTVN
jgi:hypothetical protein